MTIPEKTPPMLLGVDIELIPLFMRALRKWVLWEAKWCPERNKYDKRPLSVLGYGASSRIPAHWASFEEVVREYRRHPKRYAGIGFVLRPEDDITIVDLDRCVGPDGQLTDLAVDVLTRLDSYTELSPSGQGVHVVVQGRAPRDCTQGLEMYSGHTARYVTITGRPVPGYGAYLRRVEPTVLGAIIADYGRTSGTTNVVQLQAPDLLDELALPDIADLDLPWQTHDFLTEGLNSGDRSRALFAASVALHKAGLSDQQVYSLLATNEHAMAVALDHRAQDNDRAMEYLWVHHVLKGKAKAEASTVSESDFDDGETADSEPVGEGSSTVSLDDFDDIGPGGGSGGGGSGGGDGVRSKKPNSERFQLKAATEFLDYQPPPWLIKGLLPKASLINIYGAPGSGKSFLALDLMLALTTGANWRGKRTTQANAVYICAEGSGGFRLRLRGALEHQGLEPEDVPLRFIDHGMDLLNKDDVKDLIKALRTVPNLGAVVLDTWARVTAGADENSGQDMGRAIKHADAITKATGASVIVIGHSGKDATKGHRGWSGVRGAVDTEIEVVRNPDGLRIATLLKVKDGTGEGDAYRFRLGVVQMGHDSDGDPITTCVVQHQETGEAAEAPRPTLPAPVGMWRITVLEVANELAALDDDGAATESTIVESAIARHQVAEGKEDRRRDCAKRALQWAKTSGHLREVEPGVVEVQG